MLNGCATQIDWKSRVGSYTYDDAIKELGPPDKVAVTSDQVTVAEWLMHHGSTYGTYTDWGPSGYRGYRGGFGTVDITTAPSRFLRLTFGPAPESRLQSSKEYYR